MKKLIYTSSLVGCLIMLSSTAHAICCQPPTVPEIDGSMATIAIGLTVGVVALIREHRRRK